MSVRVRLSPDGIDPGALLAEFCKGRPETGAVVAFTGLARADGGRVLALELQAYAGFTERAVEAAAAEACGRFGLDAVVVVHRIGRMAPGQPIVFAAAAAAHRRGAFEGADFMMDYLKSRAPFWKKSHELDGARWIAPTGQDHQDAARWDGREASNVAS